MAAYLFGDIVVKDETAYAEYRHRISDLSARHGGEYVVRGGEIEVISGDWCPNRLIILRFADKHRAQAYLNDPVFHELSGLRQRRL